MRNKTKLLITLAVLCAGTLTLGACKNIKVEQTYKEQVKQGNNAIVRFDPNGGTFGSEPGQVVSNLFRYDSLSTMRLFEPNSKSKVPSDTSINISYTDHFLVGWYKEKKPLTDEAGNALDEYGIPCSTSGREQGWEYSGRWDFTQKLSQGDFAAQGDGSYLMTLYAGWLPYFRYSIVDENGAEIAYKAFNPDTDAGKETMDLEVPQWNADTGELDYGNFPKAEGKTFMAVHESKDSVEELSTIHHDGEVDRDRCVAKNAIKIYYGVYRDGDWYRITKAEQFSSLFAYNRNFEILEDLDFGVKDENGYAVAAWPSSISTSEFTGTIMGNGKTIKNVEVINNSTDSGYGGLFGSIAASATIENINFENVSFNLRRGTRKNGASFGLFAGEIKQGAKISNVNVKGKLILGNEDLDEFASQSIYKYHIGKVVGNLNTSGITADVTVEGIGGVSVQVGSDGSVTATASK